MSPKVIQKTCRKINRKIIEKSFKIVLKIGIRKWSGGLLFEVFFGSGFFRVPKASQIAKINDFYSQNGPQSSKNGAQETPRELENAIKVTPRVIPAIIPKSANVYKQTSNCAGLYLRRSTSKWCCGGVPRSVFNPGIQATGSWARQV